MSEINFKPCPFCGGEPRYGASFPDIYLRCSQCLLTIQVGWYGGNIGAVEAAWNTRIPDPLIAHQQRMIEIAKEALEFYANRRSYCVEEIGGFISPLSEVVARDAREKITHTQQIGSNAIKALAALETAKQGEAHE